jgi:hypothetical protein
MPANQAFPKLMGKGQSAIVSGEYIGLHSQYYTNMHLLALITSSLVTTSSSNGFSKCMDADITGE